MASKLGKFLILAMMSVAVSACQATRNREADSQAEFDAATKAQRKQLSDVCGRLQSEAQKRFCETDAAQ